VYGWFRGFLLGGEISCKPATGDAVWRRYLVAVAIKRVPKLVHRVGAVRSLTSALCRMIQSCRHTTTLALCRKTQLAKNVHVTFTEVFIQLIHASIKGPITILQSSLNTLRCYPCRNFSLKSCKSLLFHGGDTGSIPVQDAKLASPNYIGLAEMFEKSRV
jgi:hypothetical protein